MHAATLVVEVIGEECDKQQLCRSLSRQYVVYEREHHKHGEEQSATENHRRCLVVS